MAASSVTAGLQDVRISTDADDLNDAGGTMTVRRRARCAQRLERAALLGGLIGVAALASAQSDFDARNLGGAWERYPLALDADREAGRDTLPFPAPADPPPPPLKPEYLAEWEAVQRTFAEAEARGEPLATGYTYCLPDGMPSMMMAMFPMEVLQTPEQITMIQEAYNQVRRIYMDEEPVPPEEAEPRFWGHSAGRWEGDTLVVETVGIKDYVRFRNVPHSERMRITERMRMLDADHLENRITITDPVYLTGPWTWTWMYQRRPGYRMHEYVCEENREYADPETGAVRLRLMQDD